jgi:error-prone DNA polymerase
MSSLNPYAELHSLSNFSFLRGASHAQELIARAADLGYAALALTDECSLAGVVRAHVAAKELNFKLIIGSEFQVSGEQPFKIVVLATNRLAYGDLSQFITDLRRSSGKGTYYLAQEGIKAAALRDCLILAIPDRAASPAALLQLGQWMLRHFSGRCWLAVELLHHLSDAVWLHKMRELSAATAIPLVAAGDVHMHVRSKKPLQDVMTAIRVGRPLTECGLDLQGSAERHLRSRLRLSYIYPPELLEETLRIADRCSFSLEELRYEYPAEVVPKGATPASHLRRLTYEGAGRRWPDGMLAKVQAQIEHELALIAELQYEHYFLTVADIVSFARSRHILCQGRGSAANSVVCYCLGVTEVDPARQTVLFERFVSRERNEPPDIDVDFEHERREEVIQYLYRKYGRDRAALTAAVITYRPRSAIKDVGKALGFDLQTVETLAKGHQWWDGGKVVPERLAEMGFGPDETLRLQQLLQLTGEIMGFPRHLSQHTGGFVLTAGPLSRIVPIENASMAERTVIEWDKDDLDAMGLLKVDVLALGMLTALRKSLAFISQRRGYEFEMQDIPSEDPTTYDMICKADTVGVFQIESRAQMGMLPRLRPRCFYDLVIEVALVRPGPIQGGMVHPYLRRRQGLEPVEYPNAALEEALGRTLGVPVFQEQVMQIAMIAAGFTPGEADGLRRAMAAWKRKGGLEQFQGKLVDGMTARGYEKSFAEAIFEQIKGFSEYGFPESHAASFALLVYASCWVKCHEPAAFLAAMINSQPLGFYSPSQLMQDARRHGVEVRPVDVLHSDVDCTLEDIEFKPAVRLGLRVITGFRQASAERIVQARAEEVFLGADDLARRARLELHEMKALAAADALASLSGHRRQQVWDAAALRPVPKLLREASVEEDIFTLPEAPEGEEIVWDYASTGLTLRRHPMALLRDRVAGKGYLSSADLQGVEDGEQVNACGIVTLRQQPETAKGTIFMSLEDEHGAIQVIVWKSVREKQRRELLESRLIGVYGTWQVSGEVRSLIAEQFADLSPLLGRLGTRARNFR